MDDAVFPLELFGHIIDAIAAKSPYIALAQEQIITLKTCATICKTFWPLCRGHLFRSVVLGFDGARQKKLIRFLELLEEQPAIKHFIREIVIDLENYTWPPLTNSHLERCTQALTDFPRVNAISISYFSYRIQTLTPQHDIGSLCSRLAEVYTTQGTLHTLTVKKMDGLPFSNLLSCGSLTCLSLDRCDLPVLKEQVPSVRTLTLRKMNITPVSILSCFPNLEELNVIRSELQSSQTPRLPPPPFGIQRLSLECCSLWGSDRPLKATSAFLTYFEEKAAEAGNKPFGQVTDLGLMLDDCTDFTELANFLQNMTRLEHLSFETCPAPELTTLNLVNHLRHRGIRFTLKYQPLEIPVQPDKIEFISHLALLRNIVPSIRPICLDGLLQHPAFTVNVAEAHFDMEPWSDFIAALLKYRPGFVGVQEVEITIMFGFHVGPTYTSNFIQAGIDLEGTDSPILASKIANRKGIVIGTYLDSFAQCRWSRAQIIFLIEGPKAPTVEYV